MKLKIEEDFKEIIVNPTEKILAQRSMENYAIIIYDEMGICIGRKVEELEAINENRRRRIVW